MRRNYIYAVTFVLLIAALWISYVLYQGEQAARYEGGIFVELPREWNNSARELSA